MTPLSRMLARCALLFLFVSFNFIDAHKHAASNVKLIEAKCTFSVHKDGPKGEPITGTTLDTQLYYRIKCKKEKGYCLDVSNCTVTGDGPSDKPYPIIDDKGCTLEPSLFEHVLYEDDFTAGIYNPVPIRFRGSNSAVSFNCVTALRPRLGAKTCVRPKCIINEYVAEEGQSKATDKPKPKKTGKTKSSK